MADDAMCTCKTCTCRKGEEDFLVSSGLVQHCATHNGEMPCRSAVKRPFALDKVITSVVKVRKLVATRRNVFSTRKSTSRKALWVQQCGIFFSHRSYFVSHKEIHNLQYLTSAMIMGKVFSSNSSLKIHQGIHTGSKPFKGAECGKSFGTKSHFFLAP